MRHLFEQKRVLKKIMKKKLLVSLFAVSLMTVQPKTDALYREFKNFCTAAGTVLVCAGAGYLSSKLFLSVANKKYEVSSLVLQYEGKETLKEQIRIQHEESFWSSRSIYRNYPLLKYKRDLDWYINRLWFIRIATCLTSVSTQAGELIDMLCELRACLVADKDFIKERRAFEERREDQKNQEQLLTAVVTATNRNR